MDIEFLLFLQGVRESLGAGAESALAVVSDSASSAVVIGIVFLIYWGIDKRTGQFALMSFSVGNFVNQFLKNLACVYRPWIRDPRVVPASSAIGGATGYSFPSGHTVSATTIFGSLFVRTRKRFLWLAVLCLVVLVFVAFSRLLLGVHTPQDVLVALVEGIIVVALMSKAAAWLDEHREKDVLIAIAAVVLGVLVLAVISVKPYPMDYVDGVLLVDPAAMQRDCFEGVGIFWGMWLGWLCERRWVNFETAGTGAAPRIVRCVIGLVFAAVIMIGLDPLLKAAVGLSWAKLISRCLLFFCGVFVGPWLASLIEKRRQGK